MRHDKPDDPTPRFIDQIGLKQRNICWPETLANGRSVDAFLWKGALHPTVVQRIGAWLFGLTFFGMGLVMLSMAREHRSLPSILFSYLFILLGVKVFRNGFRKQPTHRGQARSGNPRRGRNR